MNGWMGKWRDTRRKGWMDGEIEKGVGRWMERWRDGGENG